MSEHKSEPQNKQEKPHLTRRNFLQGAIVGAGVAGIAGLGALNSSPQTAIAQDAATATPTPVPTLQPTSTPQPTYLPPETPLLDTWIEPWIWRPSDWPGQQLDLNIVENDHAGAAVSGANTGAFLFSYGGITPGPTIRMRGDETLRVRLRNMLGLNAGRSWVKAYPEGRHITPYIKARKSGAIQPKADLVADAAEGNHQPDWCLGEHANGIHSSHTTNLHTHGLHVRPGRNPDGTHSDNVILRVMPKADYEARQTAEDPNCQFLKDDEQVGLSDYEFILGDVMGDANQPHPPGTHWYHPHSHGATARQVSSGMAGYLIVEGDVDDELNQVLAGDKNANPSHKTGDYDYRERLMFLQRVRFTFSSDPDAQADAPVSQQAKLPPVGVVNGGSSVPVIAMRPGAVERWRILNGSVDQDGYLKVMVVAGQFAVDGNGKLRRVNPNNQYGEEVGLVDLEPLKQDLVMLAFDGVTLVSEDGPDNYKYEAIDLSQQNPGTTDPTALPIQSPVTDAYLKELLTAYESAFDSETSIKDAFVRPNEVSLSPANRGDVLFKAPEAGLYTVIAWSSIVTSDNYEASLQSAIASTEAKKKVVPQDHYITAAYVYVGGEAVKDVDVLSTVNGALANIPVPPYLHPIKDDECRVPEGSLEIGDHEVYFAPFNAIEATEGTIAVEAGKYRTRTICYTGWGGASYPRVSTKNQGDRFNDFINSDAGQAVENLIWARENGNEDSDYVVMPPNIRTMAINAQFDRMFADGDGKLPTSRKFDHMDPSRPHMLADTAEEWVLYNASIALWTDPTPHSDDKVYLDNYDGKPLTRAEARAQRGTGDDENVNFRITSRGVDHPFHMHTNPYWVMRIEVPDKDGNLVNILDKPRWQDVVAIPRGGGRVIFRSRFMDYIGMLVNHCHLLQHEDNGMMHAVNVTQFPMMANYVPKDALSSSDMSSEEINAIYPVADGDNTVQERLRVFYQQSAMMVDPNPTTGQLFPGFEILPDDSSVQSMVRKDGDIAA